MLETGPPPVLPRPRVASPGEWSNLGAGTRYDATGGGSGFRVTGVLLAATILVAAAAVVIPGTVGPGLGILAVGVGVALVLSGLNSPVLAMVLLLVTLFFRQAFKIEALPAEPFLFAFAGVLGAGAIALTRRTSHAPQFGPVEAAMALFIIWCIGSALIPHTYPEDDGSPSYYFIITSTLIPFTLYVIGRVVFERERAVRVLLGTVVGFFAYSILVSIMQFHAPSLVWPQYIVQFPDGDAWSDRAVGIFANPVENGFMLVVGFLVSLHLARQDGARIAARIGLYLLCFVSLYAIYLTHTRIVWLIFGLALMVGTTLLPRMRVICLPIMVVTTAAVAVNWASFVSDDRDAGGVTSSHEIDDRLNMIATAWWALGEHPVLGWGIGRFISVNTYHHQQWSQDVPWFRGYGIVSHFNELGIATELGLIGLVLWLAILFLLSRSVLRAVRTLPREGVAGRDLAVLAAVVFFFWIITGLTVDLRYLGFMSALVMLLVGVVVGAADRQQLAGSAGSASDGKESPERTAADDELDLDELWVSPR